MPKDTYYRLPEEKKNRILTAARQEFFRVSYDEASINKIIKAAEIPRGSFYQYFEDKQDIFLYVLSQEHEKVMKDLHDNIIKNKGDIFGLLYDLIDRAEKIFMTKQDTKLIDTIKNSGTVCVINGFFQDGQAFSYLKEKMQENIIRYIDYDLYALDGEEEQVYFMDILSAISLKMIGKLFYVEPKEKEDASRICLEMKKRISFMEKHFRK